MRLPLAGAAIIFPNYRATHKATTPPVPPHAAHVGVAARALRRRAPHKIAVTAGFSAGRQGDVLGIDFTRLALTRYKDRAAIYLPLAAFRIILMRLVSRPGRARRRRPICRSASRALMTPCSFRAGGTAALSPSLAACRFHRAITYEMRGRWRRLAAVDFAAARRCSGSIYTS